MIDLLLALFAPLTKLVTKAVTYITAFFFGKAYERAKAIKAVKDKNDEAKAIQDRVAIDAAERERVRRYFDGQ